MNRCLNIYLLLVSESQQVENFFFNAIKLIRPRLTTLIYVNIPISLE
ncbi:hypothetical protein SAMN05192533_105146 [Mesobacillus persicus]|uniref:Uncharacterized protein n=1 Tax=Mesobacillus persicus TaxID=930146 RepID=A0A1H8AT80_9BACI|nr:hypothetical protein SAMN05192533_105146 [Mesobacillus persicus]